MPMPAYWIARAKIIDPAGYNKYAEQVSSILDKFGGKVLCRGGAIEVMEGPSDFPRHVVIEFESVEAAKACFNSEEYRSAAAHRRCGAGEVEIVIADGLNATTAQS
jgi:uncharacterized protein (DUF1330 family)